MVGTRNIFRRAGTEVFFRANVNALSKCAFAIRYDVCKYWWFIYLRRSKWKLLFTVFATPGGFALWYNFALDPGVATSLSTPIRNRNDGNGALVTDQKRYSFNLRECAYTIASLM